MTTKITAGSRPWHANYDEGVRADYAPEVTTWTAMMNEAFAKHGDALAIEYYGDEYSFSRLKSLVAQGAAALKAFGIEKGDRVALHLPNCPWHPIFFYATLAAGGVVTHLSPLDADREIAHKMKDSGAKLCITLSTPELARHFEGLVADGTVPHLVQCDDPISGAGRACPLVGGAQSLEDFWGAHDGATYDPVPTQPSDTALLQFTGGTTGLPKAAVLTQANLAASVLMYHENSTGEPATAPGARSLVYSPLFHIMGLVTALMKRTYEGGIVHLRLRFDPVAALKEIEEKGIASMGGVPTTWIALLQVPGARAEQFKSLSFVSSGGAPMPVEVFNRVKAMTGLKVRGGWGMTETCAGGTLIPRDMPEDKVGTIGIPLPACDMKIVDIEDHTRELGIGETGEIAVRGPHVTSEYWQNPGATAESIFEGWLLTGDVGYMDEDGYFFLVDRKKDLILSGGFNVYPLVIEKAVHEHPSVSEAMAIGVPDDYRGESAKVFVALNAGADPFTLEELQAFLDDKLGRYEMPRFLEFREELPHTSVGKADRKALKAEIAKA
ncbi:MAG: AMP-binding protein [Maritimibacter sp.]